MSPPKLASKGSDQALVSPPKLASKGRHKRAEPTSPTASENVEELDDELSPRELSPREVWKLYGQSPPATVTDSLGRRRERAGSTAAAARSRQIPRPHGLLRQSPASSSGSQQTPRVPQLVLDSQETVEEVVSSQEDRLGLCLRASCVSCMYIC